MKIIISICLITVVCFTGTGIKIYSSPTNAEQTVPSYAKWGRIAMEKTKEKYPKADIIDYQHLEREEGTKTSIEKFKLWVKEENKEFGVFVHIEFDNNTEQIKNITFQETTE